MQALVKTQKRPGNMELRDVPEPVPSENEVLIEIKAVGVCGTDIHIRHDEFPYWPPVIMGHEFAGEIVAVGKNVTAWKVGERVTGEPHTRACGICYFCRTGNIQICPEKRSPGWGIDGAFARYLAYPSRLLHRLPESLPFEIAALAEPCANVIHHVFERGGLDAQDTVVIIGPGPIGLLAALAVKKMGAGSVTMLGTEKDELVRLPAARAMGLDHVINIEHQEPLPAIMEQTRGLGADLVVECSGAEKGIRTGVELLRKKGRFTAIGLTGKETIAFPWDKASLKVLDIIFCFSTSYTSWDRAISFLGGNAGEAGKLITHTEPLSNWEKVFSDLENLRGIKGILIP